MVERDTDLVAVFGRLGRIEIEEMPILRYGRTSSMRSDPRDDT
jgi:hypothetical protein